MIITCPQCGRGWSLEKLGIPHKSGQKAYVGCPCGQDLEVVIGTKRQFWRWSWGGKPKITPVDVAFPE